MRSDLSEASWSDISDPTTDDELSRPQGSRHGSDSEWVNINSMPQHEDRFYDHKERKHKQQREEDRHAQPSSKEDDPLMSFSSHHDKHRDDTSARDHHDKQSSSHDKHKDESGSHDKHQDQSIHDKPKDEASHGKHKDDSHHDKHKDESSHDKHEESSHNSQEDTSSHNKHKEESSHDKHESSSSEHHGDGEQKDAKHDERKGEHLPDESRQNDAVLLDRPKEDLSSSISSLGSLSDGVLSTASTPELIDPTSALEPHQETNGPAEALPAAWSDYMRLISSSSVNIGEPTVVVSTVYAVNTLPGTYPNIDYNALDYGNIGQIGVFTDAGARTNFIDPSAFVASLVLSLLFGYVFGRE